MRGLLLARHFTYEAPGVGNRRWAWARQYGLAALPAGDARAVDFARRYNRTLLTNLRRRDAAVPDDLTPDNRAARHEVVADMLARVAREDALPPVDAPLGVAVDDEPLPDVWLQRANAGGATTRYVDPDGAREQIDVRTAIDFADFGGGGGEPVVDLEVTAPGGRHGYFAYRYADGGWRHASGELVVGGEAVK